MPVKTSGVRKYKPGTAEYIVLHGQWRQSRGKRLSAIFSWERNPKIALEIAKHIAYFPTGAGGQFTCKIGMLVPAVPSEDGYGWWGLGYIPNSGARWCLNLPNFNRK